MDTGGLYALLLTHQYPGLSGGGAELGEGHQGDPGVQVEPGSDGSFSTIILSFTHPRTGSVLCPLIHSLTQAFLSPPTQETLQQLRCNPMKET